MSTRWVLREKTKDGKTITKARLVACSFEEQKNDTSMNDSPTCSKEVLRVSLTIFLSQSWSLNSIDIKSAFLYGKEINRQVYLKPPKDFAREGKVWLLKKTVYRLLDASKCWYTRVKEELLKLNVEVSKYHPGFFMYRYRGTLHGLLATHADDFLRGGSHIFVENVIKPLHNIFEIGSVNKKSLSLSWFRS